MVVKRANFSVYCLGRRLSVEIEIKIEDRDHYSWNLMGIEYPSEIYQPTFEQLPESVRADIEVFAELESQEEAAIAFMTEREREEQAAEHQLETMRGEE